MTSADQRFYVGGAVVLGLAYFFGHKATASIGRGIDNTLDAINPTSRTNFINRGVNAIGDILDDGGDNDSFSLGSWIYDYTHQTENDYFEPIKEEG